MFSVSKEGSRSYASFSGDTAAVLFFILAQGRSRPVAVLHFARKALKTPNSNLKSRPLQQQRVLDLSKLLKVLWERDNTTFNHW